MSCEQRTENPRVENSVITPVAMHPEGSNLIEAFLCLMVFALRGYSVHDFFEYHGFHTLSIYLGHCIQ